MTKQATKVFILFLFYVLPCWGYESNIQERLQVIPKEDREILESFFSYLISFEYFGYVLFGEKPMAAGGFDTHFTPEDTLSEAAMKQRRLHLGWYTWEKYASLFSSEKFILRLSKNPVTPSFYWIVLINKKSCLRCIEENLDTFKSMLGDSFNPQLVLDNLAKKEDIFGDVLKKQEALLGILFGYGKHNARVFQQQSERCRVSKVICSNRKKAVMTTSKLTPFNCYNRDLFLIDLPRFAEDCSHSESLKLHQSYESTWKLLSQMYVNKNFLEITLTKLTEVKSNVETQ